MFSKSSFAAPRSGTSSVFYVMGGIRRGLVVGRLAPKREGAGSRLNWPLYMCGVLDGSLYPLQLNEALEPFKRLVRNGTLSLQFVKRRGFLCGSGLLFRRDVT